MADQGALRIARLAAVPMLLLCVAPAPSAQVSAAVTRIITSHLDEALGQLEFRTVERRQIRGTSRVETLQAGRGVLDGSFTLDTSPTGMRMRVDFGTASYDGETFEFDGTKSFVGFSQPARSRRSALGGFIADNEVILREGLLGGVLNAGWPVLDVARRQAKIDTEGLKTFDGQNHYRLRYRAKTKQGDLNIALYFDARTYRHKATVYSWSRAQDLGRTIVSSSQEQDVYLQLEERFDDFQSVGRLTLPRLWTIDYIESANKSASWRYTFKVSDIQRP